jgi:hypothetical protein
MKLLIQVGVDRLITAGALTRKQSSSGLGVQAMPMGTRFVEPSWAEQDGKISTPFAALDVNHHRFAIDVGKRCAFFGSGVSATLQALRRVLYRRIAEPPNVALPSRVMTSVSETVPLDIRECVVGPSDPAKGGSVARNPPLGECHA